MGTSRQVESTWHWPAGRTRASFATIAPCQRAHQTPLLPANAPAAAAPAHTSQPPLQPSLPPSSLQAATMPLARSASSPVKPLLPVASPPTSPGVGRLPLHQQPVRRRARRVMLLGLLAFVAVNAAWGSRALFRAMQSGGGSGPESLIGGQPEQAAAVASTNGSAASAKAASAADSAVEAALDAGAALRDAAGAVKYTAEAAGQAASAAAGMAAPVAVKAAAAVGNATTKVASALAGAVGDAAAKTAGAVSGAAGGTATKVTGTVSKGAGAAGSAAKAAATGAAAQFVWEERPGGAYPPAELLPPVVEAASNDICAQVRFEGGAWLERLMSWAGFAVQRCAEQRAGQMRCHRE